MLPFRARCCQAQAGNQMTRHVPNCIPAAAAYAYCLLPPWLPEIINDLRAIFSKFAPPRCYLRTIHFFVLFTETSHIYQSFGGRRKISSARLPAFNISRNGCRVYLVLRIKCTNRFFEHGFHWVFSEELHQCIAHTNDLDVIRLGDWRAI